MTPTTWPDPQREGYPMNHEKDGQHWFQHAADGRWRVCHWTYDAREAEGYWTSPLGGVLFRDEHLDRAGWVYHSPCLPPADLRATDLRAAEAASFKAGVEAASAQVKCGCSGADEVIAAAIRSGPNSGPRWEHCSENNCGALLAADIRALPIPDASALATALEQAREQSLPGNLVEIIETEMTAWKGSNGGVYTIHACALAVSVAVRAAAIRARTPTTGETTDAG